MKRLLALLIALGSTHAAVAQTPATPVLLNHLSAVLDSATYADVAASPFLLAQFAASRGKMPLTWFGKHTYLELFDPHGLDGAQLGDVGIALGVETPGAIAAIAHRYTGLGAPFDTATERRGTPPQSEPFYHTFRPGGLDATSRRTMLWIMEYAVDAARTQARKDSLPDNDRGRDRFLADRYDPTRLLAEITGATMAIPVDDITRLVRTMERLNVEVIREGEGAIIRFPSFTLRLIPAWERPGLRRLEFSLSRDAEANPSLRFGGHSRLRFGPGRVAAWDFALP
ncbi:MAG: DUF5829 family protein [Gemmatimonadales bacterium]